MEKTYELNDIISAARELGAKDDQIRKFKELMGIKVDPFEDGEESVFTVTARRKPGVTPPSLGTLTSIIENTENTLIDDIEFTIRDNISGVGRIILVREGGKNNGSYPCAHDY